MRSGNVDVLRAITQHGLYLSDTWELDIHDCISCSLLLFSSCLVCSQYHSLAMNCACLSLCPTLGSAVYCAFLKCFAVRPKPILPWHLLFETPGLCSLVILFLPAGG